MLCIPSPKTRSRVRRPHASVIHCLSQISRMISRNMARKMMIANTCANICVLLFSHNRYPHQKLCRYHLSFVSDAKSQSPVLLPILTVNIGNHEISLSGTVLMYASYISFKKQKQPHQIADRKNSICRRILPSRKLSAPLQKNKATDPSLYVLLSISADSCALTRDIFIRHVAVWTDTLCC